VIALLLAAVISGAPVPNTMPNPAITPGVAVSPEMPLQQLCTTKWGKDHRAVTEGMKMSVYHAYGFTGPKDPRCTPDAHGKTCEIDHLWSRENGGADDVRNLWPEPYGGPWNAHDKDRLENALHADICVKHSITPLQARAALSDWQHYYVKEFGAPPASALPH